VLAYVYDNGAIEVRPAGQLAMRQALDVLPAVSS
jgi:hypothetical protein